MSELRAAGIHKRYGGMPVLEDVSFAVRGGEIHALLGENGAGKSTLIKALSGLTPVDQGEVWLDGSRQTNWSERAAREAGIATVHQEVRLIPHLSVAENLLLGREPRCAWGIDWKATFKRAGLALAQVNLDVDPRRELGDLRLAERQLVAIARALEVDARFLMLDEPTSSLDAAEVEVLFARLSELRSQGIGVVFITHFLDQADAIADRVTILRNGTLVGTWPRGELSRRELVGHMVGRDADDLGARERSPEIGDPVAALPGLGTNVRQGEILGLAGLLGSGRTEALLKIWNRPRRRSREGFALIPEDRRRSSVFPGLSVAENLRIAEDARGGWFSRPLAPDSSAWATRLGIRPEDPNKPIELLSGGNQQKVILARWLNLAPRVLLLDEPTRGIDVGAKFELLSEVSKLRSTGVAVVFAGSETAELARVCDRVVVLHEGDVVKEIAEPEETGILRALSGDLT